MPTTILSVLERALVENHLELKNSIQFHLLHWLFGLVRLSKLHLTDRVQPLYSTHAHLEVRCPSSTRRSHASCVSV